MSQINPQTILDEKVLIPSEHTKCQQVGIDLTLRGPLFLAQGASKNVLLNEEVHLPETIFATLTQRSTFNRIGVLITGSIYDPGYEGQIGCTVYNLSGSTIQINANERVAQMVFFKASPASKYDGQYQGEHLNK